MYDSCNVWFTCVIIWIRLIFSPKIHEVRTKWVRVRLALSLSLHCVPRPYHSDSYNAFQNICCANECKCISSWPLFCVICSDDSRKLQTFQKDWNKNKYYRSNFSQLSLKKHQAFLNHGWVKCQIQISILEIHRQNKQFEWLLLTSWLTRLFTFTINLNCLWTDPNTTSD